MRHLAILSIVSKLESGRGRIWDDPPPNLISSFKMTASSSSTAGVTANVAATAFEEEHDGTRQANDAETVEWFEIKVFVEFTTFLD